MYKIEAYDVEFRGYLSDVATSQLSRVGQYLTSKKGTVILHKASVLSIPTQLFLRRDGIVPELRDYELEGNLYLTGTDVQGLLFPQDLIRWNHISVSKWRHIGR